MTANLYEWALQRRRNRKEEGRQEAWQEIWKERQEQTLREQILRAQFRREQIDKVLAADTLTAEGKVHLIGILNAV